MDTFNTSAVAAASVPGGRCELGEVLGDRKGFVCLGPGSLCEGGEFIGGSGAKPLCRYPTTLAGYAVLLTIISILMLFERIKHWLVHTVPRSYMPVMNAMFGELSSLGFVSLVAFFFEFEPPGQPSVLDRIGHAVHLGHEIHIIFVRLHFLLFGVSISFICLCLFILFATLRHNRPYKIWSQQLETGNQVLHMLPEVGQYTPETRWMHSETIKDKMEIFLRLFLRFTDPNTITRGQVKIPPNFNLGHYLTLQSSQMISTLIQIEAFDWVFIVVLAGVEFFAWFLSKGWNEEQVDGGLVLFWVFDGLVFIAALALDYKLHWIVSQLIPLAEDHALDEEPSVVAATVNLLSGMSQGIASLSRSSSSERTRTTVVALYGGPKCNRPSPTTGQSSLALPIHQGDLRKRGRINKAFQDRYFVLKGNGQLCYYDSERSFANGCKAKGFLSVINSRIETLKGPDVTGFLWALSDEHGRILELLSSTSSDRKQWIAMIELHSTRYSQKAEPMCQGVMRKRGRVNTSYQNRFFVLFSNGRLCYYEDENDFELSLAPSGSITILGAHVLVGKGLTNNVFKRGAEDDVEWTIIEDSSDRHLILSCDDQEQVDVWCAAIVHVSHGPGAIEVNTQDQKASTLYPVMPVGLKRTDQNMESLQKMEWSVERERSVRQDHLARSMGACKGGRAAGNEGDGVRPDNGHKMPKASLDAAHHTDACIDHAANHTDACINQDLNDQDKMIRIAILRDQGDMCCSNIADDIAQLEEKIAKLESESCSNELPLTSSSMPAKPPDCDQDSLPSDLAQGCDGAVTPCDSACVSPGDSALYGASSWPNDAEMTPASFAAAWSDVELALEFMNRTPSGMSAPSSWDGSIVANTREGGRGSRDMRGGAVNVSGQHFGYQTRVGCEDIRLDVVQEELLSEGRSYQDSQGFSAEEQENATVSCQPTAEKFKANHRQMMKSRQSMLSSATGSLADLGIPHQHALRKVAEQRKRLPGAFASFKSFRGRNRVASMIERVTVGHDEADDSMQVSFQSTDAARKKMRSFVPPYMKRPWKDTRSPWRKDLGGHCINNHQKLFWLEKNGPKFLLRMIRYLLLGCVVMITITLEVYRTQLVCEGGDDGSGACVASAGGVVLILAALLPPLLTVALLTKIINNYVVATSIEMLRSQESILQVVQDAQAKRTARLFNTLVLISSIIEQISRLGSLAEEAAERKLRRQAGDPEDIGKGVSRLGSGARDLGKHEKDKKRHDSQFLEELDELYLARQKESPADENGRRLQASQGTRSPYNQLKKASKLKPLRSILGRSKAKKGTGQQVAAADNPALKSLSRYQLDILENYEEMFKMADTSGNGVLDMDRFIEFLQSTGAAVNSEQAVQIFEVIDIDGDGCVSWSEFEQVMAAEMRHSTPESVAESSWLCFDPDNTGQATPEQALVNLERLRPGMDFMAVKEMIHSVDIQRKGFITKAEYVLWVERLIHDGSLKLG